MSQQPETHISLDLETLSTSPNAVILSIGAVAFNLEKRIVYSDRSFFTCLGIDEQISRGAHINDSTVKWWISQATEAKNDWIEFDHRYSAQVQVRQFANWCSKHSMDSTYIWSHGASFDVPIMETCFDRFDIPIPWNFRNIRDTRTLFHYFKPKKEVGGGTKHTALADAIRQSNMIISAHDKYININTVKQGNSK